MRSALAIAALLMTSVAIAACGDDPEAGPGDAEGRLDAAGELAVTPVSVGPEFETLAGAEVRRRGEGKLLVLAQVRAPSRDFDIGLTVDGKQPREVRRSVTAEGVTVLGCLCEAEGPTATVGLRARSRAGPGRIGERSLAVVDGVESAGSSNARPLAVTATALTTQRQRLNGDAAELLSAEVTPGSAEGLVAIALLERGADRPADPETIFLTLHPGSPERPTLEREISQNKIDGKLVVFAGPVAQRLPDRLFLNARIVGGGVGLVSAVSLAACACELVSEG